MNHNANDVGEEFSMKKFRFLSALLALVLVFGLAVVSCGGPDESPVVQDLIVVTGNDMGPVGPGVPVIWNPKTSIKVDEPFGLGLKVLSSYHDLASWRTTIKRGTQVIDIREGPWYTPKSDQAYTFGPSSWRLGQAGTYTIEVYFVDEAGNKSNTKTVTLTVTP